MRFNRLTIVERLVFASILLVARLGAAQQVVPEHDRRARENLSVRPHQLNSKFDSSISAVAIEESRVASKERPWRFGNASLTSPKARPDKALAIDSIWIKRQEPAGDAIETTPNPAKPANSQFATAHSSRVQHGTTGGPERHAANQSSSRSSSQIAPLSRFSEQTDMCSAPHKTDSAAVVEPAQFRLRDDAFESGAPSGATERTSSLPAFASATTQAQAVFLEINDDSDDPQSSSGTWDVASMIAPGTNSTDLFSRLEIDEDFRSRAIQTSEAIRNNIQSPDWMQQQYSWISPVFYHEPLYFEQPNLERYGLGPPRGLRPILSSAHFFGSIPLIPGKLLRKSPCEHVYTLGNYRPGNLVPRQRHTR